MARRRGIVSQVLREIDRANKAAAAQQRRNIAANNRAIKAAIREEALADRENKKLYIEQQYEKSDFLNNQTAERLEELNNILICALDVSLKFDFQSLIPDFKTLHFSPSNDIINEIDIPLTTDFHDGIKKPSIIGRLIPGAMKKFYKAHEKAMSEYEEEVKLSDIKERQRLEKINLQKIKHQELVVKLLDEHGRRVADVTDFEAQYMAGDADAIVEYNTIILNKSNYDDEFPKSFSLAYSVPSKMLVIEYELPKVDIVPAVASYKYIRTRDDFDEKLRRPAEIKKNYQDIIASVALRTIFEVFSSDSADKIDIICFNGFIHTRDAANGRKIKPHLISVRVTKEDFAQIELENVDRTACLRSLGASVSRSVDEAQPIRPIVNFKMTDHRFVDQEDLLSELDDTPNLMDLTPIEFEVLIANLFEKMGFETRLTRSHKDGGVDCVVFDQRPVLGGKIVIQAKRYKNTVGVGAVRELYGTMMNEGASKGILITTSGFGQDSARFSSEKPIELYDGNQLLFMLEEVGIKARIIMPDADYNNDGY